MTALADRKKRLAAAQVAVLIEHRVDQGAITIDRAVEVLPTTVHANIRLVDVPALTDSAFQLRRSSSASTGVSLASQSRTAS